MKFLYLIEWLFTPARDRERLREKYRLRVEYFKSRDRVLRSMGSPRDWLQRRVTVADAEAAHMHAVPRCGADPVPFGYLHRDWVRLLSRMREGDELWEYDSPPETWGYLCGRAGYAVVRQGKVVAVLETEMN